MIDETRPVLPANEVELTELYREVAAEHFHKDEEFEVDGDAQVRFTEDGAEVSGWTWVSDSSLATSPAGLSEEDQMTLYREALGDTAARVSLGADDGAYVETWILVAESLVTEHLKAKETNRDQAPKRAPAP